MIYMIRILTVIKPDSEIPTEFRSKPYAVKTYLPVDKLPEAREFVDMVNTMCQTRHAELVIACRFGDRPAYLTVEEFKHVAIEIEHMAHELERGKIHGKGKKETDWDQEGTEDFPTEPARS